MAYYRLEDHKGEWLGKVGDRKMYSDLNLAKRSAKSLAIRRGKNPETRGLSVKLVRYEADGRVYDRGTVIEWFHH